VVTKSTVPVGTGRRIRQIPREVSANRCGRHCAQSGISARSSAIEAFMRPDRVVIGTDSEHARAGCVRFTSRST
jgi:UDPglucose 6-dehydrogenase